MLIKWQVSGSTYKSQVSSHKWQVSIHPLEARKSVNSTLSTRLSAFSLIPFSLTGMLSERSFLNQEKTASCRSLLSLFFNFFQVGYTLPDLDDFCSVCNPCQYCIFLYTTFISNAFFCCSSAFNFLQRFIFLCDWNVYSFHLNKIRNCSGLCYTTESLNLMFGNC